MVLGQRQDNNSNMGLTTFVWCGFSCTITYSYPQVTFWHFGCLHLMIFLLPLNQRCGRFVWFVLYPLLAISAISAPSHDPLTAHSGKLNSGLFKFHSFTLSVHCAFCLCSVQSPFFVSSWVLGNSLNIHHHHQILVSCVWLYLFLTFNPYSYLIILWLNSPFFSLFFHVRLWSCVKKSQSANRETGYQLKGQSSMYQTYLSFSPRPLFACAGQQILSEAWQERQVDMDRKHVVQSIPLFAGRYGVSRPGCLSDWAASFEVEQQAEERWRLCGGEEVLLRRGKK